MRPPRLRPSLAFALVVSMALGGCTADPATDSLARGDPQPGLTREYDPELNRMLTQLVSAVEVGADGELRIDRMPDRRFLEPDSGLYWQISGEGAEDFRSRSLWDRRLKVSGSKALLKPISYNSDQFPNEPLRIAERTVRLPGSEIEWRFVAAMRRDDTGSSDGAQSAWAWASAT